MNERDELRGTLSNTICNASNYPPKAMPYLLGGDMSEVLDRTTDAILAAGYRKPRTITTAEELDALPDESVVMEQLYRDPIQKFMGSWRIGDACVSDFTFPVVVLWEPR